MKKIYKFSLIALSVCFLNLPSVFAEEGPQTCLKEVNWLAQTLWQQQLLLVSAEKAGVLANLEEISEGSLSEEPNGDQSNYYYTAKAKYVKAGQEGYYDYFFMAFLNKDCSLSMVHQSAPLIKPEKETE